MCNITVTGPPKVLKKLELLLTQKIDSLILFFPHRNWIFQRLSVEYLLILGSHFEMAGWGSEETSVTVELIEGQRRIQLNL